MKSRSRILVCLFALIVVAGCASTKTTEQHPIDIGKIPRPDHILVYDFVATPRDAPTDSDITVESEPQTPEQIEAGRQLGAQIAKQLVADIQGMGLPAVEATSGISPQVGDVVIRGYLVSIEAGSAAKRLVIGFGAGSSELTTAVEGYLVTAQGMRKLGSGSVESGGSKTPGAAMGAVVAVASGNPVGLIVSSGMKIYGEASGKSTLEGRAKATAAEISDKLKVRFQKEGWIA